MNYSLLLVEDTLDIWESIKLYLEGSNYHVDRTTTIAQAHQLIEEKQYDCVIIDRMLPDGNGVDLCRSIKISYPHTPCILETAKFQIEDKIEWFDSWADDYIVKPYDLRELQIRVDNLIERFRNALERSYHKIVVWNISINIDTMEIKKIIDSEKNYELIHCTANERIVIKMICDDPNKVIPRVELCEYIRWDEAQRMSENKLDVLISWLRKKLWSSLIKTIKWVWYKLGE